MQEILNYKIHSISEDKSQPSQKDRQLDKFQVFHEMLLQWLFLAPVF